LTEFLKYGEKYNIDVYAAVDAVGYGVIKHHQGPVYEDSSFDGVTQVRMINNNPNNLEDIRNRTNAVAANLSLTHPKAQNLLITVCRELTTNYPELKGICLDVLRFEDLGYCMSDYSIQKFADYIGATTVNRNDIITSTGGKGKLFKEWVEFRASIITSMVERVKDTIKGINPDIQFHLWSAGQWSSRFEVGQNWASVKHPTSDPSTYTANYQKLGFAHMIDAIVPGAYTSKVWNSDGDWSVQYYLSTYDDIVRKECKVINSLTVYSYIEPKPLQQAMELSLLNSDGVMLFDLCHIEAQNMWDPVAETIKKYAK
ncbi:MAG: family 10 glycosylhydrolase, partial [Muribaculaceae bacterium]|nr:family 10 glycosylhydrolase [Muribaculaceae bacterium]